MLDWSAVGLLVLKGRVGKLALWQAASIAGLTAKACAGRVGRGHRRFGGDDGRLGQVAKLDARGCSLSLLAAFS